MKASETKLGRFLETNDVQMIIPIYQRNYSWDKENIEKLIEDINQILNTVKDEHYLGSIVYYDDTNSQIREYLIIDGQQRITSIFILLYAIKNYYYENKIQDESLDSLKKYLENQYQIDKWNKLRLKPAINDDNEFEKIINRDFDMNKNSLVVKAYEIFKKQVDLWYKKYKNSFIKKIIECLDRKINIVYIHLEKNNNSDDPQQIFESINSTGKSLKESDLIRNYLFMGLNDNEQSKLFKQYWTKIEQQFKYNEVLNLNEVFRLFLAYENKSYPSKRNLYKTFKEWHEKWKMRFNDSNRYDYIIRFFEYFSRFISYLWIIYFEKDTSKIDREISSGIFEFRNYLTSLPATLIVKC